MLTRWEPDTNIIESSPGVAALNILMLEVDVMLRYRQKCKHYICRTL